jgi:hypothetical protein
MNKNKKIIIIIFSTLITVLVITAILNICPPKGPWPMPPWCKNKIINNNIDNIEDSSNIIKDISKNLIEETKPKLYEKSLIPIYYKGNDWLYLDEKYKNMTAVSGWSWNLGNDKKNIEYAHKHDSLFISEISLWNNDLWKSKNDLPKQLKDAYIKDFDGNLVMIQDLVFMNLMHPEFQLWLKEFIKNEIDNGVDGFVIDETVGTSIAPSLLGGFDNYSLTEFNNYLKKKYTLKELSDMGINDINSFNYKNWIIENNLKESYGENFRELFLGEEFYNFHLEYTNEFIYSLIKFAKNYSNKDLIITANVDPLYYPLDTKYIQELDYYTIEHFNFYGNEFSRFNSAVPSIKYSNSLGKHAIMLPAVADYGFLNNKGKKIGSNLVNFLIAESYATNSYFMYFDIEKEFMGYKFIADKDILLPYYSFIRNNPKLFLNLKTNNKVGIIHPPLFFEEDMGPVSSSIGYANSLSILNIGYDFTNFNNINNYDLILTTGYYFSDDELNMLLKYVEKGGNLIVTDSRFARFDKNKNPRKINNLFESDGEKKYGNGNIHVFLDYLGWKINAEKDYNAHNILKSAILKYTNLNTAPENIDIYTYYKDESVVIHMINYNFENNNFTTISNFEINVEIKDNYNIEGKEIFYYTPKNEPVKIDYDFKEGRLSSIIPYIEIWGVLYIK